MYESMIKFKLICKKFNNENYKYHEIIHINIRSLKHNFDKLSEFINSFHHKPKIVCLTETWLVDIID